MRKLLHTALVGVALASPAIAQTLDDKIDAASRRWQSYQERLQSSDPVTRSETLAQALRDDNQAIRNGALWYALRSRPTLPISLVLPPGSAIDIGTVPSLDLTAVTWSADRHTLRAKAMSQRTHSNVEGELVEGTLRLVYASLAIAPGFVDPNAVGGRLTRSDLRRCILTLSYQSSRDSLEGPLQCEGLSQRYTARLPLG